MKSRVNYQHRNIARVIYNSRSPVPDVWQVRTTAKPWQFAVAEIITAMVIGYYVLI